MNKLNRLTIITLLGLCALSSQAQDEAVFQKVCATGAGSADIAVNGKDNWCFLRSELRHLSVGNFWGEQSAKTAQASDPKAKDPLKAIIAYKALLEKENIQLMVVPIPPKAVIYPDKLAGASLPVKRYDRSLQLFYQELRTKGVHVVDLTDVLLKARKSNDEPLYCLGDSHFSGEGCKVIANALAGELKNRTKLQGKSPYSVTKEKISLKGDLYKVAKGMPSSEERTVYSVKGETKDATSAVLLFGDSHTLVFDIGGDMYASQACLASQLAAALGMPVDVIGVRGSGATPARINIYRRSKQEKDFLKKKKVFIWCFAAREFTEASAWNSEVPVQP